MPIENGNLLEMYCFHNEMLTKAIIVMLESA